VATARRVSRETQIVVLSAVDQYAAAATTRQCGAPAFVKKGATPQQIHLAVAGVADAVP
jgi:DNA-binding NarL/FixJ family response regulator